jgi:DNA-binding PadR family transcriptional regulator
MKQVEEDSGMVMGPGTVYGSLQRLEEAGWVSAAEVEGGDPRRGKHFVLTRAGREALGREALRLSRLARLAAERGLAPEGGPAS